MHQASRSSELHSRATAGMQQATLPITGLGQSEVPSATAQGDRWHCGESHRHNTGCVEMAQMKDAQRLAALDFSPCATPVLMN